MKNRQLMTHCLLACLLACPTYATYTYVIDTYQQLPDLTGTQSMLITGQGGGGGFYANDNSLVNVESTSSPLEDGISGVWEIHLTGASHLDMSGGQVNLLSFNNDATASLTGGLIQEIWSYQYTATFGPHITIVYSGDLPMYNETTDLLTGLWGGGDPFSIYLSEVPHNSYGYSPAIDNIQFQLIPEPATVILLGMGGLLLKRKR